MAHLENQYRVVVEFLRAAQSGRGRIIRLNHSPTQVPPQLAGRLHPGFWQAFMEEAGQLSLRHPYCEKPKAKNYCTWAACFGLGAVVGLFCLNPDAGDYGVWESECRRFTDRWAPGFAQAGCALTLQRGRDYWLQLDINAMYQAPQWPVAPAMPPPLAGPAAPAPAKPAAAPGSSSSSDDGRQQQQQQLALAEKPQAGAVPPKTV